MGADDHWVEAFKQEHECDEHWQLRRSFLLTHKDKFPEQRLVCLAQVFTNVEFLGCRYPQKTMQLIAELSKEVAAGYRERQKSRLQRTFVQASDAAGAKVKGLKRPQAETTEQQSPSTSNNAAPKYNQSTLNTNVNSKSGCTPAKNMKFTNFVPATSEPSNSTPTEEISEVAALTKTPTEVSNSMQASSENVNAAPLKLLPESEPSNAAKFTPGASPSPFSAIQKQSTLANPIKFTNFVSTPSGGSSSSVPEKEFSESGPAKTSQNSNFPVSQASNSSSTHFQDTNPTSAGFLNTTTPHSTISTSQFQPDNSVPNLSSFFERRISNGPGSGSSSSVSERGFTTTSVDAKPLSFSHYGGVRTYHIDRPTAIVNDGEVEEMEGDLLDKEPPNLPPSKTDVAAAFNAINSSPYGRLVLIEMPEQNDTPTQIIHRSTVACRISSNYVYEHLPGGKVLQPRQPPPDMAWKYTV